MKRVICGMCKARFYFDEDIEEMVNGEHYCSYCFPKVNICAVCKKVIFHKQDVKNEFSICKECRRESGIWNILYHLRFKTFERDRFTCRYCGRSPLRDKSVELHCDHIIPKSKGGKDELDNLVTSCKECNHGKICCLLNEYNLNQIKNRKVYEIEKQSDKTVEK